MNKNWLTYLFVISLALLWSCSAADKSSEAIKEEVLLDDIYAEGEDVEYSEATEEATTEEMGEEEAYEYSKVYYEEESYAIMTTDQLAALQDRSVQKVNELFEYVTIMSNDEYDMEMRRNAKKMAVNLFDEKAKLYAPSVTGSEDSVTVKVVLKDILKGKINVEDIEIESIGMNRELNEEVVSCSIRLEGEEVILWFYVEMANEVKQFGNTSQEVWTVYLGDVFQK